MDTSRFERKKNCTVAVYSNIYCASLRAVNPPNLWCKEYGKLVARILQYSACLTRV